MKQEDNLAQLNGDIKKLKEEIAKKASQSEIDKLKDKCSYNDTTPHRNTSRNASPNQRNDHKQYQDNIDHIPVYKGEEVVLIMDSNMNYIKPRVFWKSGTFKLKCGRADQLEETLKNYDLSRAKHIFIGTGTNDPQYGQNAADIFHNLYKTAEHLSKVEGPCVHLAQLPPRLDEHNSIINDVNALIKSDPPPHVNIILHENITNEDMADSKHIHVNNLRKFVGNMKDGMRKVNENKQYDDRNTRNNTHDTSFHTRSNRRDSTNYEQSRRGNHSSRLDRYRSHVENYDHHTTSWTRNQKDDRTNNSRQQNNDTGKNFVDLMQNIALSMESNTSMLQDLKMCIHELKG